MLPVNRILCNISRLMPLYELAKNSKSIGEFSRNIHSSAILDKLAFGFYSEDILKVPVSKIKIQYLGDWENAFPLNGDVTTMPPIELVLKKGSFYVEDGHHRLKTAIKQKRKDIRAKVYIKSNPVLALGFTDYDNMLHQVWNATHE